MTEIDRSALIQRIETSLDNVRPYLKADGGDIEVVELTDDFVVKVKLLGACESCPVSFMTMKAGVEENLKRDIPELKRIEALNVAQPTV
ncbi:MAG: NifU family protein [Saprospiraceae bacterium]|nr:NifU family protein [Saprospiraceae bacterium]